MTSTQRQQLGQILDSIDEGGATIHLIDQDLAPTSASNQHRTDSPADSITGLNEAPPLLIEPDIVRTVAKADKITGINSLAPAGQPPNGIAAADATAEQHLYLVFLDGPINGDARGLGARAQQLLGDQTTQDVFENLNGFSVRLTAGQAQQLRRSPGVRSIEADQAVSLVQPIRDDHAPSSSAINATNLTTPYGVSMVWGTTDYSQADNRNKYAFILDTGVSTGTGDLIVNSTHSRNFTSRKTGDWIDYDGHGTHVAGTVAAVNDTDGVVGVAAGAQIISVRVLDRRGSGQTSWIVAGINHAAGLVRNGALSGVPINHIVANMSLGGGLNTTLDNAVRAAAKADGNGRYLRIVVAAGNSGTDVDTVSPANTGDDPNIYTVSAVNASKVMASWSNFDNGDPSDDCDFSAPGVGIQSLGISAGSPVTMSGTSMAAPHVAGALLLGTPLAGSALSTPVVPGSVGDPFAVLS